MLYWFNTEEERNRLRKLEDKVFLHVASRTEIVAYLNLRDGRDAWYIRQPWFDDYQEIRKEVSGVAA